MQKHYYIFIGLFLIGIIIGFLLPGMLYKSEVKFIEAETKIDTIIKIKENPPLEIVKYQPKIRYLRDTIFTTYNFTAQIDTVIIRDTLKAEYHYPENIFSMKLTRSPDSLIQESITKIKIIEKQSSWWQTPLIIAVSVCGGYIISEISK